MRIILNVCLSILPFSIAAPFPTNNGSSLKLPGNTDTYSLSEPSNLLDQGDSLNYNLQFSFTDSLHRYEKDNFKLNEDAVKSIRFDFTPTPGFNSKPKSAAISKPWMDFQVDLSVPKNMIDTTKVRKPKNYIRMLPYSIWTKFGEDPVYDVYVFGNKKRLEMVWKMDLDDLQEFGRNMVPSAGRYNPNNVGASVVIGNLDFIGFLYDNFNKLGRIKKHNRKHANAWKTYAAAPFHHSAGKITSKDSIEITSPTIYGNGLYHNSKSVELIEETNPKYFSRPDYRLLQTTEQRSRFGTFIDPELYAIPEDTTHTVSNHTDSLRISLSVENTDINGEDKKLKEDRNKFDRKGKKKKKKIRKYKKENQNDDNTLKELPNSMDDLYKYIRIKQQQDSIQRKEKSRKDKVNQNVYELEQQIRKLAEQKN